MSFLFRCCCRPFLKGGDDGRREFYDLLEVSRDASTEDIKRAYKRKSLALHPDKLAQRGQVLTPEDQARFQRVKEAYEVLVDDKRRDLYDEFGESGMKIIDDPQSVDPQTAFTNFMRSSSMDRCAIFSTIVGICAFILLWPVLLCLQTDKTIHIPWTAIWAPLWVLDAFIFVMVWFLACLGRQRPPEGLEEEWKDDFFLRMLNAVQFSCNVLFQIFLTLKLDKVIAWDWSNVFAPWLAWEGLNLFRNIDIVRNGAPIAPDYAAGADEQAMIRSIQVRQAMLGIQHGILRVIFVALAILKLDGKINVTWWVVFTPLWLYFGTQFLGICVEYSLAQRLKASLAEATAVSGRDPEAPLPTEEEILREQAELMASRAAMLGCQAAIVLMMALLGVARIEGAHYSVFIIFLPVFLIMGCFTCSLGCAVCCLRDPAMMNEMGEGMPLNPGAQANTTAGATSSVGNRTTTTGTARVEPGNSNSNENSGWSSPKSSTSSTATPPNSYLATYEPPFSTATRPPGLASPPPIVVVPSQPPANETSAGETGDID